jgi:hypothetical protein
LALDPDRSRRAWIEGWFFSEGCNATPRRSFQAARRPIFRNWSRGFGGFSRMPVDECAKFDAVIAVCESAAGAGIVMWRFWP